MKRISKEDRQFTPHIDMVAPPAPQKDLICHLCRKPSPADECDLLQVDSLGRMPVCHACMNKTVKVKAVDRTILHKISKEKSDDPTRFSLKQNDNLFETRHK